MTKEEVKEAASVAVPSFSWPNEVHPCFSFYNNLESLNISDLPIKQDYKYTIVHPYKYSNPTPFDKLPKFEVNLKLCTVKKGVPYGLAIISFAHSDKNDYLSFEGVGIFSDGKLHMGPFTCITRSGEGLSFSQMLNGRPADSHYRT